MTVTPTGAVTESEEEAGSGGKFACGGSSTARGGQSSSSAMAADERREKGKLKTSGIRGSARAFGLFGLLGPVFSVI
jgi:hypothetical protein